MRVNILAGGRESRRLPLTLVSSKQFQADFGKPKMGYPRSAIAARMRMYYMIVTSFDSPRLRKPMLERLRRATI